MKGIDIDKALVISKKASSLMNIIEGIKPEIDTIIAFMPEVLNDMLNLLEEMRTILPHVEKTRRIIDKTIDLVKDEREADLRESLRELNKNLLHMLEGFTSMSNNLQPTEKNCINNETPIAYKKESIAKEEKTEKETALGDNQSTNPLKPYGENNLIRDF